MTGSQMQPAVYGLLAALFMPKLVRATSSVPIVYCASLNTASTAANSSIYQSDGLCYDFCVDSYAYAIVQDKNCWCSNYTPDSSEQVSTSKCSHSCPGYPSDLCGGDNLFGYMQLSLAPSGTAGAASTAATSTPKTTSTIATAKQQTTKATTASPTVKTVTADGNVQTVTITPTAAASSAPANTSAIESLTKKKGLSTGAAVGIAIGVVVAAVFAAFGAFCLWRRKRNQAKEDAIYAAGGASALSPRGSARSGGRGTEKGPVFGQMPAGGNWTTDASGRRRSLLMPIDPRIDPAFSDIYARNENKSRESVTSLRDDHDYSRRVHQPNRVLRATNPDPDLE